jgi:muramidase (phage lysozyme)
LFTFLKNKFSKKPSKVKQENPFKALLDLIASGESHGNYNIVYGGKRANLTDKNLLEVKAVQSAMLKSGSKSTAVGRYQIIHRTLEELINNLKLPNTTIFDERTQDFLCIALLHRRGLKKFLSGQISTDQFMLNISKEWASLPKDSSGLSYYHGDGLNKAHVHPKDVLVVLGALKAV